MFNGTWSWEGWWKRESARVREIKSTGASSVPRLPADGRFLSVGKSQIPPGNVTPQQNKHQSSHDNGRSVWMDCNQGEPVSESGSRQKKKKKLACLEWMCRTQICHIEWISSVSRIPFHCSVREMNFLLCLLLLLVASPVSAILKHQSLCVKALLFCFQTVVKFPKCALELVNGQLHVK